jgi:hypothetical protein
MHGAGPGTAKPRPNFGISLAKPLRRKGDGPRPSSRANARDLRKISPFGREQGHKVDDWLQAEAELVRENRAAPSRGAQKKSQNTGHKLRKDKSQAG